MSYVEANAAVVQVHPGPFHPPSPQIVHYHTCPYDHSINPMRKHISDPGPMGLFAFATIAILSGSLHAHLFGDLDAGLFSPAICYGGLVQIIAGIFDFLRGNQVGGSTFMAFGFYWFSMGLWSLPIWSMRESYGDDGFDEYRKLKGMYCLCFAFIALTTTICDMRGSIAQIILMSIVVFDFFILAGNNFSYDRNFEIFLGWVFMITGVGAYYVGSAHFLEANSRFHLPLGRFENKSEDKDDLESNGKSNGSTRHDSRLK